MEIKRDGYKTFLIEIGGNSMDWNDIEVTLKLLKEAEKNGEEVEIQCPVDNCDECPFGQYCK